MLPKDHNNRFDRLKYKMATPRNFFDAATAGIAIYNSLEVFGLLVATFLDRTEVVRFLLNRGASAHQTYQDGGTPLGLACLNKNVDIVRLLLNAGAILEARDPKNKTALHHAAFSSSMEVLHELILERNANMFVADDDGLTPFDEACLLAWIRRPVVNPLLEMYGTKSTQDHGSLALHAILRAAKYSFLEYRNFHTHLNPLRISAPCCIL